VRDFPSIAVDSLNQCNLFAVSHGWDAVIVDVLILQQNGQFVNGLQRVSPRHEYCPRSRQAVLNDTGKEKPFGGVK
jgi:hypothetical protein